MEPIIKVDNISKSFYLGNNERYYTFRESITNIFKTSARNKEFKALQNISFDVYEGDIVGIIGRNGAGKSTLLKILSRIIEPTTGYARISGRMCSLLEVGTGFHPELTGRENIFLNGTILGMNRKEIKDKFDEIVAFADIEQFIDTPLKRYSSGMQMRLAFAVAAHLSAEILIIDEVLAVGDVQFQKKCLSKMNDISKSGKTILFVSHNLAMINNLCNKGILLSHGEKIAQGPINEIIHLYLEHKKNDNTQKFYAKSFDNSFEVSDFQIFDKISGKQVYEFMTGENYIIKIKVESSKQIDNMTVSLGIDNFMQERITFLSNLLSGDTINIVAGSQFIYCEINKFPLISGTYNFSVKFSKKGETYIWVPEVEYEVLPGSVFEKNTVSNRAWLGHFFVENKWYTE